MFASAAVEVAVDHGRDGLDFSPEFLSTKNAQERQQGTQVAATTPVKRAKYHTHNYKHNQARIQRRVVVVQTTKLSESSNANMVYRPIYTINSIDYIPFRGAVIDKNRDLLYCASTPPEMENRSTETRQRRDTETQPSAQPAPQQLPAGVRVVFHGCGCLHVQERIRGTFLHKFPITQETHSTHTAKEKKR